MSNFVRDLVNGFFVGQQPFDIAVQITIGVVVLVIVQLIIFVPDVKQKIIKSTFKGLKIVPFVKGAFDSEKNKVKAIIYEKLEIKDEAKHLSIPNAVPKDAILADMLRMSVADEKNWKTGKVSGCIYEGSDEHTEFLSKVYSMSCLSNALHPDVFKSTRKYEAEIIRMTAEMCCGDNEVCGALTSGGTESILMACKTYRDQYGIKNPEMVVPISIHAAFDKAAKYFGIKIIHTPLDENFRADVKAMERAITKNTIFLAGSAPNFPYGTIDPIPEMAALAKSRGLGFHSDACLGGYLLPWLKKAGIKGVTNFDFSVDGVTSMSVDTHKYGYTTKGTSVVLFKNEDLRRHMFFVQPDWPGGMYASPTMAGSRSGGLIACCYASLLKIGRDGFMDRSMKIFNAAQRLKSEIKTNIPELTLAGDSYSSVIAFTSSKFNILKIGDVMTKKGYHLNSCQKPACVHICVTYPMVSVMDQLIVDLKDSVKLIVEHPNSVPDGMSAIYGMAASFPDRATIGEIGLAYLDAVLST